MKTLLIFLSLLFPLYRFCEKETQGFSLLKIARASQAAVSPPLRDDLRIILEKPFHYLGKGGQAFAFVSEDGKYVIKFPRRHFTVLKKRKELIEKKWERDAASYTLASTELKEESGLLYAHLYKSRLFSQKLRIVSPLKIEHLLDLDESVFLLQKRAEPLLPYLKTLIEQNETERAKETLGKVVGAICARCKKGIADEDPRLHKNLGFLDGKPLFLDVGRFKRDPNLQIKSELARSTARLTAWLQEEDPRLAHYLQELVAHANL